MKKEKNESLKTNIAEFCIYLKESVEGFTENLKNDSRAQTEAEWFKTFLRWMEWGTDVHKIYWEDADPGVKENWCYNKNAEVEKLRKELSSVVEALDTWQVMEPDAFYGEISNLRDHINCDVLKKG